MIESFFFIPGNHPKLSEKLKSIEADFFILDLEDSVDRMHIKVALENIAKIELKQNLWVRPQLFDGNFFNSLLLKELLLSGFRNILIPKISNVGQLNLVEEVINSFDTDDVKFILLVENPECLQNIEDMLNASKLNIFGIGFGSQDYCTITNMHHKHNLLMIPRFLIANAAKAHQIKCIDIACMDIYATGLFQQEIMDAFQMGYDAKFIIHPDQLKAINSFQFYSKEEVKNAEDICAEYERLGRPAVCVIDGNAVEPPHISNFVRIINWGLKYYGKK